MPSRRRSANKNLGNNLAEVQRRLRYLERRPIRSKLGSKVVTGAAIAPNSVTADQVTFGTTVVSTDPNITVTIDNPKDGLVVANPATGQTQVYSEEYTSYISVSDPVAAGYAFDAYNYAGEAQTTATNAFTTADGKNKIFYSNSAPASTASYTLKNGDLWFDTSNGYQLSQYANGWSAFKLGSKAIDKIEANQILAGTITATLTISAPTLNGGVINAARLNGGEIYGTFIATSESGPRLTISDSDTISFYSSSGLTGTISPLKSFGGGESYGIFLSRPNFEDYFQIQDFVIEARNYNFDGWSVYRNPLLNGVTYTMRSSGTMQIEGNDGLYIYDSSSSYLGSSIFMAGGSISITPDTPGSVSIDGPLRVIASLYSSVPVGSGYDGEIRFVY